MDFKEMVRLRTETVNIKKYIEITDHFAKYVKSPLGVEAYEGKSTRLEEIEKKLKERFPNMNFVVFSSNYFHENETDIDVFVEEDGRITDYSFDCSELLERKVVNVNIFDVSKNKRAMEERYSKTEKENKMKKIIYDCIQEVNQFRLFFLTNKITLIG